MTLWVDPAPSMRTSTDFACRAPGSWARAAVITAMWSAAVFDPALPGRSAIANGSPVPAPPWSTNAHNGWNPKPFLFSALGGVGVIVAVAVARSRFYGVDRSAICGDVGRSRWVVAALSCPIWSSFTHLRAHE